MTEQFPAIAAQNTSLLEAIHEGPADSLQGLADRAQLGKNNMNRKLDGLLDAGLIVSTGEASHEVALTAEGERALHAMAVYRGELDPGSGGELAIPFDRIVRWLGNPRTQFDAVKDEELAVSIGDKGILQAIIVRAKGDDFEVVIGERRRRAATIAVQRGWLPADFAVPCKIRDYTDDEAEEVAGVENIQREDMHWMDEAQWYLKLANRLSGPAIERLVGGTRGKRSIQDYIKCARELSPSDVARTYLPDGHKDQLTYVRARDLVGEKKERPALELTPKLARTFLELIHAGLEFSGIMHLPENGTVTTMLWSAPVGGPFHTLSQERKLTVFGFENRQVVARTVLTEPVVHWLKQLGFDTDRERALYKVRAAEFGELQAGTYAPGAYVTPELVEPEPAPMPAAATPPIHDTFEPAEQQAGFSPPPETEGTPRAAATSSPTAPLELPPMLAIVVVEAAHKISGMGYERGEGTWVTPVLSAYYKDARGSQLVQGHKMLAFFPHGEKTVVCLGKEGRDWLWEKYGVEVENGHCAVDDALLAKAQMEFLGQVPADDERYSTFWLNPPAEAETVVTAAAAAPSELGPLTPSQRRILREIAARSIHQHRLLDGWVLAHVVALTDPDFQALWDLAFVTHQQGGDAELKIALTLAGRDHLKARGQAPQDGLSRNSCATPWLREKLPDPLQEADGDEGHSAPATSDTEPRRDQFATDIIRVTAESRAFASLFAAARSAAGLLQNLKGRSKAPKAEDVDPVIRLIETAMEACTPYLPQEVE